MSQRGPLFGLAALLAISLMPLSRAQPAPSGDLPIVPNPNIPESSSPTPTSSPTPASPAETPKPGASPVASDKAGLYISDSGNHRIMYLKDIKGEGRKVLGRPGHEPGYFLHPCQIWVDPAGKIFVADRDNNRIVRMDEISGWGWKEMPGFNRPEGVASRGDEIYVADTGNNQVIVYGDMDGRPLRSYKDPRLNHPTSLWLDQNKDLYVTCGQDPPGGRVVKLVDPADQQGTKWEVYEGQNLKQLGFAPSQMVTWKRHLWMVDPVASRLIRVDNFQGRSAREWGGYGANVGKFRSPSGLGLSKEGNLYVADSGNDRIVEVVGNDPKDWQTYMGAGEGVQLRNPTSVFSWCPVPAPPPPEDTSKKPKKPK
jgi:sugar lactone lactonase YvrE